MSLLLSATFFILFGILVLKFLKPRWRLYKLNIPSPLPFVLETFSPVIFLAIASPEERFEVMVYFCLKFRDLMKVWIGPKLLIFVNHPERIQKVLLSQKCVEKWNFFYRLMGRDHGLIAGSVKRKWKEHRKFFNFAFNLNILESFLPTFVEYSETLCNKLEAELETKEEFDFSVYAKRASFDILCATSLGTNMKDYQKTLFYDKIFDAFETTELAFNEKFTIPFLYPQTFYKLTKMYQRERRAKKMLDEFQRDILAERRRVIKKSLVGNINSDETIERNILIDHIILNEEKFTSDEIRDHILTFVSGYETWSVAISNAILLLAMHPEVQDRLYDEVNSINEDDLKSSEIINNIQYLDYVQKETFRILPTIPMILRETLDDFEMEPGLVIPKNTNLIMNFYALHRRKDIWGEDADQFKPERFSPENSVNRHPFAFLPFASGSRICIAYKYSNISLKIAMIKLVQQFRFSTEIKLIDIRLKSYISMKLCNRHLVTIEKRSSEIKTSPQQLSRET